MHMHQKKQPNNTTTTMQTIPMQKLEKMHEKNKQPNKQRTKKTTQKGGKIKKMTPDELIQVITLLTKGFGVEVECKNQQD